MLQNSPPDDSKPKAALWSHPWLRWLPPVVALIFIALFVHLGRWQLDRAQEKRNIIARAEAAPELLWGQWQQQPPRYAQLSLRGRFDQQRHVLLDNQVLNGRSGVHVWTPFKVEQGSWVLINRGWLPLAANRELPQVTTPSAALNIHAQVNEAPRVGLRLGQQQALSSVQWPQLITYLDPPLIAAATNLALPQWILQLDPASPAGFAGRQWPVVNFGPNKHLSYAWTWFSLAFTVAVVTLLLQWRGWRGRRSLSPFSLKRESE